MGYMRHHAIIVTTWDEILAAHAYEKAVSLFRDIAAVSPILRSSVNVYSTFLIAPDGSKEGWGHSVAGDRARLAFIEYLDSRRYEDGSSSLSWCLVRYGDEEGQDVLEDSSARYMTNIEREDPSPEPINP